MRLIFNKNMRLIVVCGICNLHQCVLCSTYLHIRVRIVNEKTYEGSSGGMTSLSILSFWFFRPLLKKIQQNDI